MSTTTQKLKPETQEIAAGNDLPEGWDLASIGEVLRVNYGKGLKEADRVPGEAAVFGSNGVVGRHRAALTRGPTIIIGRKGTIGAVHFSPRPCWPIDTTYFIDDFRGLDPIYVTHALRSLKLGEHDTSTAIPGLNRDDIYAQEIPLAPPAEQKRIVAKVEELFAQVNAARARLAKVAQILKRFRQAVLAAACSGRLTEDWRSMNPRPDSVAAIVDAIRRRREFEASSVAQKEKFRQIYENSEESDSTALPESWGFVCLNKLCTSFDYGTSAKSQPSGKVPVLRMGNVQCGKIDWTDLVYTSDREEIQQYSLQPNTVLFNRTNSPELVGKTALYRGERPAIFAGYLIRIVVLPELDPRYLNLCLNSNYARAFCSQVKTDGVSQSNINAQKLGLFEVPYCPLTEQHEIIRRVEALFNLADAIEKRVGAATKRAEKLTQAILAEAFRGELVPTEAELARREGRAYEPASALLARIRAKRVMPERSAPPPDGACRHRKAPQRRLE